MSEKGEKKGSNANRNAKSVPRAAKEPEKGPRPSKPSGAVPELDLFCMIVTYCREIFAQWTGTSSFREKPGGYQPF